MSEDLWNQLQEQLSHETQAARPCVACWYREHPTRPFPSFASSSLCRSCAQRMRTAQQHRREVA